MDLSELCPSFPAVWTVCSTFYGPMLICLCLPVGALYLYWTCCLNANYQKLTLQVLLRFIKLRQLPSLFRVA
jgi:hypothetical protein